MKNSRLWKGCHLSMGGRLTYKSCSHMYAFLFLFFLQSIKYSSSEDDYTNPN